MSVCESERREREREREREIEKYDQNIHRVVVGEQFKQRLNPGYRESFLIRDSKPELRTSYIETKF